MKTVDIPIDKVQVINRLRKIDQGKVEEISQSIETCDLLHLIQVASKDQGYILLSGGHRVAAMNLIGLPFLQLLDPDKLINQLVEVSEKPMF